MYRPDLAGSIRQVDACLSVAGDEKLEAEDLDWPPRKFSFILPPPLSDISHVKDSIVFNLHSQLENIELNAKMSFVLSGQLNMDSKIQQRHLLYTYPRRILVL